MTAKNDDDDGTVHVAEEYDDPSTNGTLIRRMGAVLADESVNAIAIVTVGIMAIHGVKNYEPYTAIASVALGAKYIRRNGGN